MKHSISFIFSFTLLILFHPTHAYSQSNAAYVINGHKYDMAEDLFYRMVQEWYDATLESIGFENLVDSLAKENKIDISELSFPRDLDLNYLEDTTGVFDIAGRVTIASWTVKASGLGCDFAADISEMSISFEAKSDFVDGNLLISDIKTEISAAEVKVTGTGGILCQAVANELGSQLSDALLDFLGTTALAFEEVSTGGLFDILNPVSALHLDDPALIAEALEGFPMNMKISTLYDSVLEKTQLITTVNFLTGTITDPEAFLGIEPQDPTSAGLHYGGFSYLYWVLQRGFPWHADWTETQRVDEAFDIMQDHNIRDYRLEIRWRDLQKKVYLGAQLHPDSLELSEIDPLLTDAAHWDTSAFGNTNDILADGSERNFNAFMAIGVGHQDRMPEDESGKQIAPATEGWTVPENYVRVSAEEYLYNLKIYAHAVVRKFAAIIDIWQIENELNAAGFAAADSSWWRKGDLWQDREFRNRVWDILVQAVRTEDPTARITHSLHMLGFMSAMESWLDDMDIVGVNFFPNQVVALPVMGFVVGEYIWAVRRVLEGLGYPDKSVWLIETGYPGIEATDAPDTLRLEEDLFYFSEERQAAYIESAVQSAAEKGAEGFFYYSLTAQEDMPEGIPDMNKFIRYSGLIRRETDQAKPGLEVYANQLQKLIITTVPAALTHIVPHSHTLYQNYPNPFNPYTIISWQLAERSHVELSVYNLTGEKVTTLVSNRLDQGFHSYRFEGHNLASGIYYYRLVAGSYREAKKMILIK